MVPNSFPIRILAVDPGTALSGWIELEFREGTSLPVLGAFGKSPNAEVVKRASSIRYSKVVIEKMQSYGRRVGSEVFETCWWSGYLAAKSISPYSILTRSKVKGWWRAKNDAQVRTAVLGRWTGLRDRKAAAKIAVGSKKCPGPLYGVTADVWQALALGVAWYELEGR